MESAPQFPAPGQPLHLAVKDGLHRRFLNVLEALLPLLTVLYLATALIAATPVNETRLAALTGAAAGVTWILVRRGLLSPPLAELAAAALTLLMVFHGLAAFHAAPSLTHFARLALILLGAFLLPLSLTSFSLLACLATAGWLAISIPSLSGSSTLAGLLGLTALAALIGAAIPLRLKKLTLQEESHQRVVLAETEKQNAMDRLRLAVEGTRDGHWYWDLEHGNFHASPAWAHLLGYEPDEMEHTADAWFSRVDQWNVAKLRAEIDSHIAGDTPHFRSEHRIRRKDGLFLWTLARASVVRDHRGKPIAIAGSHSDISHLLQTEKRLLDEAFTDTLTGLANRKFFMDRLRQAVERHRIHSRELFGLLFLDLDRFKIINDSLGHLIGDELLKQVANRLRAATRESDVVARFGGDEFVILQERLRDPEEPQRVATRIQQALAEPFLIDGREIASGASIGIALSNVPFENEDDLLRFGDTAMYAAKKQRRRQAEVFEPQMLDTPNKLCSLQNDLARALSRDELTLHYQPCFSLASGRIVGAEALIRWHRPNGQFLLPSEFIPLAEELGLIHEIGDWALETACRQNRAWQQSGASAVRMAVNLSALQLQQSEFPKRLAAILAATGLPLDLLELELTETSLLETLDGATNTLHQLQALGVRMSLDDFGTGYSSLNYLREFQFQTLKIDRCIASAVAEEKKAGAIARGLITLAHNLDLSVIAEGIETESQLAFFRHERCDQVQGYYTGRPVTAPEFEALLRSHTPLARTTPDRSLLNLAQVHKSAAPNRIISPR